MSTAVESHVQPARTSDVGTLWKDAIDDYERITDAQIQILASAKNIDGIVTEITENETRFRRHRHDSSKLDKFRALVRDSRGPIEVIGDIVTQATKATFPPGEAIFVAVRHLIKTANAVSADYDKIAEFFEDLNSYLKRLKVWEGRLPDIPELRAALKEVFTSVLVLCGICTKHTRMGRMT